MAVLKKSVAFDEEVGREALERAGERGFSRFVNDAVAQRLQAMRIAELYAEYEASNGRVSDEVRRNVSAEWDAATGRP